MQSYPTELSDVIYNAATQCFEARVTVYDAGRPRSYACAIEAPITMTFEDAAKGLATQARRRHVARRGLASHFTAARARPRAGRKGSDPVRWLERLINPAGQSAA